MVEYEEKHTGSLALSLLINESSDLMSLNSNSIKNETTHSDPYLSIVCLIVGMLWFRSDFRLYYYFCESLCSDVFP